MTTIQTDPALHTSITQAAQSIAQAVDFPYEITPCVVPGVFNLIADTFNDMRKAIDREKRFNRLDDISLVDISAFLLTLYYLYYQDPLLNDTNPHS